MPCLIKTGDPAFTSPLRSLTAKIFQIYLQKTWRPLHPGRWDHAQKSPCGGVWEEGEPRFHQRITEKRLLPYGAPYSNLAQPNLQKRQLYSDVLNMHCRLVGHKYPLSSKEKGHFCRAFTPSLTNVYPVLTNATCQRAPLNLSENKSLQYQPSW